MDYYLKNTALYFQVKEAIKKYIRENNLKPGEQLFSEQQMMKMYGVSRITLRRALDELEQEGVIYKIHGKGSFVAMRIKAQLSYLSSFTEDLENRGYKTHAKVLENTIINPPQDVKQNLNLNDEEKVILVNRVRYANDQPIAVEKCYMPAERFKSILDKDLSHMSINKIMQTEHNVIFSHAKQWIGTHISTKYLTRIFNLGKPIAILAMKRLVFDIQGRPVQYTLSYYRGDMYEYEIILPMKSERTEKLL